VGEVVVRDLQAGGIVEHFPNGGGPLSGWVFRRRRGRTRAIGQEAVAQRGQGLYDEDLGRGAGQSLAAELRRCRDTIAEAAR